MNALRNARHHLVRNGLHGCSELNNILFLADDFDKVAFLDMQATHIHHDHVHAYASNSRTKSFMDVNTAFSIA